MLDRWHKWVNRYTNKYITSILLSAAVVVALVGWGVSINRASVDFLAAEIDANEQLVVDTTVALSELAAAYEKLQEDAASGDTGQARAAPTVEEIIGNADLSAQVRQQVTETLESRLEGVQGERGPRGFRGDQGRPGSPGEPGASGEPGEAGTPGPAGADGPAGSQGERGSQGEPGPQGPQGPSGAEGPAGPSGPAGDDADVAAVLAQTIVGVQFDPVPNGTSGPDDPDPTSCTITLIVFGGPNIVLDTDPTVCR